MTVGKRDCRIRLRDFIHISVSAFAGLRQNCSIMFLALRRVGEGTNHLPAAGVTV